MWLNFIDLEFVDLDQPSTCHHLDIDLRVLAIHDWASCKIMMRGRWALKSISFLGFF
jgi:hypothetical protein